MSGISGYGSPVKKQLEENSQQSNATSQPAHPPNADDENSAETTTEANVELNPTTVIESIFDQSKKSDTKLNPHKVNDVISETSYISVLSGTTSQSYEALYSSEDSLPKVIDERDEKRKSCIIIRDSTTVVQTEDIQSDNSTKSKLKSKTLLDKADNDMKDDGSEPTAQKQSNPLLNINEPKEVKDDTKSYEDSKFKEVIQAPSANAMIVDQTAQFSQDKNNKKENAPTSSTTKDNETKKTGSFTTQYLLSAEKLDKTKLKKLSQTQRIDNLDQRSKNANDILNELKTDVNTNEVLNRLTIRDSTITNAEDLQRGENCLDTLPTDKSNDKKPIGMSPGKLDILNDLQNTGEGTTHYDIGDNLLEKPNAPISIAETRKTLSTESQIENLRKIRHILEDKLNRFNNPEEEEDEENHRDTQSDLESKKARAENAGKSESDESEHTKLLDMLTEKTSKTDKLKSVKSSVTVVEVVKFLPEALLYGIPSTGLKLTETQAANNNSLKQNIPNEAPIVVHSEDTSEIIQVILPDEIQKAALIGELVKVEPRDSCKPCPGIKPIRASCLDRPEEPVEEPEKPPPPRPPIPPEKKPGMPFECFEPEDTPEYEGSDSESSEAPSSQARTWWWKIKQRFLSVILGIYNCFHCDRICPIYSPAPLQSPNTSAAYEAPKPLKIRNSQINNSNSALIHSKDSVHVHTRHTPVTPQEVEQRMIKSEGLEPEKSRSTVTPEKIKSTRFDLDNIKAADSDEIRKMPVKSTVPRKF